MRNNKQWNVHKSRCKTDSESTYKGKGGAESYAGTCGKGGSGRCGRIFGIDGNELIIHVQNSPWDTEKR